ncbi:MAG: DUF4040 domain-containing protein [Alphaproteobacteria bacterium]|nr:DUF4040 domain-containing protein [Alphaproteobacteria bacterium]
MQSIIGMVLMTLLAVVMIGIIRLRNLFAVVIFGGIYSLLMVGLLLVLDAVDVAMTEAAVGGGLSTVLMLSVLYSTKEEEIRLVRMRAFPLFFMVVTGVLIFATWDLLPLAIADLPSHTHVSAYYLDNSLKDTGVPNVVTSVLASYRGYDTLGEVTVIFAAGIAVLVLLQGSRIAKKKVSRSDSISGSDSVSGLE